MTNEITTEEAVKQIKENCYFASISEKTKQALDTAIKALDQVSHLNNRPCEACEFHKETGCVKWECVFKK